MFGSSISRVDGLINSQCSWWPFDILFQLIVQFSSVEELSTNTVSVIHSYTVHSHTKQTVDDPSLFPMKDGCFWCILCVYSLNWDQSIGSLLCCIYSEGDLSDYIAPSLAKAVTGPAHTHTLWILLMPPSWRLKENLPGAKRTTMNFRSGKSINTVLWRVSANPNSNVINFLRFARQSRSVMSWTKSITFRVKNVNS